VELASHEPLFLPVDDGPGVGIEAELERGTRRSVQRESVLPTPVIGGYEGTALDGESAAFPKVLNPMDGAHSRRRVLGRHRVSLHHGLSPNTFCLIGPEIGSPAN
jgi:hypothetical protein